MEVIGIQTRIMRPPKDDIYTLFDESVVDVREKDVILISSKIMAIHQGRCISVSEIAKEDLVKREAEKMFSYYNESCGRNFRLTLKGNTLVGSAGIDESNGNGYYILWPENSIEFCKEIRAYFVKRFALKNLAVICVDSHCIPLRYGAVGISIGYYGMHPLKKYAGTKDLFERAFVFETSNKVDMLAGAGTLVMGEGKERCPLVIIRGGGSIEFVDEDTSKELFVPLKEDIHRPMFEIFP
ncbi:MAG: hypothetical protein EOM19_03390 [Candidatus Moranbacteria bacterium]|nr:hypothetical protein [Candidatus Moranbacteria bacterium]